MKLLALDTSTLTAGIGVGEIDPQGDLVVRAVRRARVTTHSEMLVALLAETLDEAGVAIGEVDALVCGAGPGSFTGLRIGMATAKGLCFALGRPLYVVSSLAALALRAPEGALVSSGLDAYKGELYAGLYRRGQRAELEALGAEVVLPPAGWAERLSSTRGEAEELVLVGDAFERYPELVIPGARRLDEDPAPHPADVLRLGARDLARGEKDVLVTGAPRYIRPSEAELKLKR